MATAIRLDVLKISKPCTADWERMTGDDQVRFCGLCKKNVYHLSQLTREEADQLLQEKEGQACVRLYRRQDGTVVTSDCGTVAGADQPGRHPVRMAAAAVILLLLMGWGMLRASKNGDASGTAWVDRMRTIPVVGKVVSQFWPIAPLMPVMGEADFVMGKICPVPPPPVPVPAPKK